MRLTPDAYRARARLCDVAAAHASMAATRDELMLLAGRWRAMADQVEGRAGAPRTPDHDPDGPVPPAHPGSAAGLADPQ